MQYYRTTVLHVLRSHLPLHWPQFHYRRLPHNYYTTAAKSPPWYLTQPGRRRVPAMRNSKRHRTSCVAAFHRRPRRFELRAADTRWKVQLLQNTVARNNCTFALKLQATIYTRTDISRFHCSTFLVKTRRNNHVVKNGMRHCAMSIAYGQIMVNMVSMGSSSQYHW